MADLELPPIVAPSLKAQCVALLENRIISGSLAVGTTLPPERELAKQLGVSRPVLHEAIVDLAGKGFLAIEPRRGVQVRDFYRQGTLAIFEAIARHDEGSFAPAVLKDIVAFRALIEVEAARLAAQGGGGEFLEGLKAVLEEEARLPALPQGEAEGVAKDDAQGYAQGIALRISLDLDFHLLLAEASGSRILPLVVNSIAPAYRALVERFYRAGPDLGLVLGYHRALVAAIEGRQVDEAARLTQEMLAHGARVIGALDGQG